MLGRRDLLIAPWTLRSLSGQFRADGNVVLVPVVVQDASGQFIRGIQPSAFTLLENGRRIAFRVEDEPQSVALVLALHASFDARKPLDRLRKAVRLFGDLVAGANGVSALLAFRDEPTVVVRATADFDRIAGAVRALVASGTGCALVDAIRASAEILSHVPKDRRKVIVIVTDDRDRSSRSNLRDLFVSLQRHDIGVYALTYSPALMQWGREVPTGP